MGRISILIPTRKRFPRLCRTINSFVDLADQPDQIEFIIGVDSDDIETCDNVGKLSDELAEKNISFTALEFPQLGYHRLHDYLNAMWKHSTGDWLIFFNDDAVMVSPQWDTMIRRYDGEFKCLAFDTHNHHPYSIFPIIPRAWIEHLGTVSNHHMFDAVISQIAYLLDIMERTSIKADHERFDLVGGEADETAQQRTMYEGNPSDPRDINHTSNIAWRQNMAEKLSQLMQSCGLDTEFWQRVKKGQQDPWEKLRANDHNNQMYTYDRKK